MTPRGKSKMQGLRAWLDSFLLFSILALVASAARPSASLIVKEHDELKYPEGAACASVLIAGEKGGDFARTAFQGVGIAVAYAILQKVFHVIAETPAWVTSRTDKWLPNATVNGEITPEYMGVGYIIGPKIAGVLVAGGVLAWLGLIPLLGFLVPGDMVYAQLVKVGNNPAGFGWDPATHTFGNTQRHLPRLRAPDRRRGGGRGRLHHAGEDSAHHLHVAARLDPLSTTGSTTRPTATATSSPGRCITGAGRRRSLA